ncbi:MAG: hypothetical protein ACKVP5_07760 [Aestuariivirga sp.]
MTVHVPLLPKRLADDDFAVMAGEFLAGRIMRKSKAFGESVWLWTVTGPYLPPQLQPGHGEADNLDAARAAFRAKFDAWRVWAAQQPEPHWHVAVSRLPEPIVH